MSAVHWEYKKSPFKVLQKSFRPLRFPVNKCLPASLTHAQTLPLAVRVWFLLMKKFNVWSRPYLISHCLIPFHLTYPFLERPRSIKGPKANFRIKTS